MNMSGKTMIGDASAVLCFHTIIWSLSLALFQVCKTPK